MRGRRPSGLYLACAGAVVGNAFDRGFSKLFGSCCLCRSAPLRGVRWRCARGSVLSLSSWSMALFAVGARGSTPWASGPDTHRRTCERACVFATAGVATPLPNDGCCIPQGTRQRVLQCVSRARLPARRDAVKGPWYATRARWRALRRANALAGRANFLRLVAGFLMDSASSLRQASSMADRKRTVLDELHGARAVAELVVGDLGSVVTELEPVSTRYLVGFLGRLAIFVPSVSARVAWSVGSRRLRQRLRGGFGAS